MEKVAGGESPTGAGLRPNSAVVERRERAPSPKPEVVAGTGSEPSSVPIATVAAQAEEGKVKSLSTLASVTESIDDAVEVLNQALSLKSTSAMIRRDEELNRYLVTIKDKESGSGCKLRIDPDSSADKIPFDLSFEPIHFQDDGINLKDFTVSLSVTSEATSSGY